MAIVKRLVKGSALTHAELDGNFDQLVADIGNKQDALPSQTGNNGKVLSTNGTAPQWITAPDGLPSQTGNSGKYLTTNGTAASWATVTGGSGSTSYSLSGNLTLDNTYNNAVIYNTSASNYTVSIPAGLDNYFVFYVQQNGAGTITIQEVAASGVVIDGAPLVTAGAGDSIQVLWLGTDHYAVSMAELPDYSALDEGKVLAVDASGDLVWVTLNPTYTLSGNLTVTDIHNNSVIYNLTSSDYTVTVPSGLPDYFSLAVQQNGPGSITLAAGAGVTIDGLPAVTVGIGDVITLNWISADHYSVQTSQIPEYTVADEGKVLTVGVGGSDIEWSPTSTSGTIVNVNASRTLLLSDDGNTLLCDNGSTAIVLTIPENSSVAFPLGAVISAIRYSSGTVSFSPVNGNVSLWDSGITSPNQYGSLGIMKIKTNEWILL